MSQNHLNSLQDIVRLTIRQELLWSEQRFKRVVMSEDADGKPAELYGADGKIYYRKAGGVGVEIAGAYLPLDGSQAMTNDLNMGGNMLWNACALAGRYDGSLPDFTFWGCNSPLGNGVVEFMRWDTSEQNILIADKKITGLAAGSDPSDAVRFDQISGAGGDMLKSVYDPNADGIIAVAQTEANNYSHPSARQCSTGNWAWASISGKPSFDYLPLAGNTSGTPMTGTLHMGGQSLSNAHIAGTNNTQFILDQDNTGAEQASEISFERGSSNVENARLKWSASNTRFDLMSTNSVYAALKVGSVDMTGNIDMGGGTIEDAYNIYMHESGIFDYLYLKSQSGVLTLATFLTYTDTLGEIYFYGLLNMGGHQITNLGAGGAGTSDAARMSDLGTGVSKILNAAGTTSVECKVGGDIDITVPSGKVVTFIRS